MRFLAFLLTFLVGVFLASFVKAEECTKEADVLKQLDDSIKNKDLQAAVAFKIEDKSGSFLIAAVIKKENEFFTIVTEFKNGCAVILDGGGNAVFMRFSPDQLPALSTGVVIFEGGDIPSFLEFRS